MPGIDASLLNVLLAVAAMFLGLSLFVQVIQELYKYVTSNKARAYEKFLVDFLGPWVSQLHQPGVLPDLEVRGPFQVFRRRPKGKLMPLGKDELTEALERIAPAWHQRALAFLRKEVKLQQGRPGAASPLWKQFLEELKAADPEAPDAWNVREILDFLKEWHPAPAAQQPSSPFEEDTLDAQKLMTGFRERFLSHLKPVEEHFDQMMGNFDYVYRRRSLRQTFVLGLLAAVLFNLPLERIWDRASALSPEEVAALAEQTTGLYQTYLTYRVTADSVERRTDATATAAVQLRQDSLLHARQDSLLQALVEETLETLPGVTGGESGVRLIDCRVWAGECAFLTDLRSGRDRLYPYTGLPAVLRYALGCLLTAVLVSFGAPFWNDLVGLLQRFQGSPRTGPQPTSQPGKEEENA